MNIKIIAADDHRLFLEGLKSLFSYTLKFNLIDIYYDGNELLNGIRSHEPDIALIDLSMPGASTQTIISEVDKHYSNTKLIALTMHMEPRRAEQLLKLGLNGYVLKEAAFDELNQAIYAVMAGEQFISSDLSIALQEYHENTIKKDHLTKREIEVLQQVAQGLSNKEIARVLNISERTVRFHTSNFCIKLNAKGRSNAVAKAMQLSLL